MIDTTQLFEQENFEDYSVADLIEVLKQADNAYFNTGETIIDDNQYDALKQYVHSVVPTDPYFLGVGSTIRGGKVKLPFPMGSLTQAYQGDMQQWISKHRLLMKPLVVMDKLDGFSALVVYDSEGKLQIAYSRGDGTEGADITRHIKLIPSVPKKVRNGNMVVRGEVIISKEAFPLASKVAMSRSGKPYKNARNMVSGLMNAEQNNPAVYQYVDFVAFDCVYGSDHTDKPMMMDELALKHGFLTPGWQVYIGNELNDHVLTERLNERRQASDYEIDGLVVEVVRSEDRNIINPTKDTLNPEYARKYKVADESNLAFATVKEVQWNISKDGYLKPRVKIEPVELVGVTVQHATGFNAAFIYSNKIGPGAKIKITRSGDVIPFILGVVEPMPHTDEEQYDIWFTDEVGKFGDWEWTETEIDIFITDAENNPVAKFERLKSFFDSLDVPSLGEGNLAKAFERGVTTPEDVIELTQQDWGSILGSRIIGKKVFEGIRQKLTNIPLYVLMGAHPAFGRGVGVRKMKKLYEAFEGLMGNCTDIGKIVRVEGFDHKTAVKVVAGHAKFVEFFERINHYVTLAPYEAPKQGKFSGQQIVFTGFRNKEWENLVAEQGGKISTSVSGKTTLVVASDVNSDSGKAGKARSLGIKIISVEQFGEML